MNYIHGYALKFIKYCIASMRKFIIISLPPPSNLIWWGGMCWWNEQQKDDDAITTSSSFHPRKYIRKDTPHCHHTSNKAIIKGFLVYISTLAFLSRTYFLQAWLSLRKHHQSYMEMSFLTFFLYIFYVYRIDKVYSVITHSLPQKMFCSYQIYLV